MITSLRDKDGLIWEYSEEVSKCMNKSYYTLWVGFKTEAISLEHALTSDYIIHEETKQ